MKWRTEIVEKVAVENLEEFSSVEELGQELLLKYMLCRKQFLN
ncbi:hypothetical protein [Flavobacterium hibisci]|nr:hypothetical protein [Flavobacterium hibisci]